MKKVDLIVYRDKIKKLHKAAVALKEAHDAFEDFQSNKLITKDFDLNNDWKKLTNYMQSNPDLSDKLDEVEDIIRTIHES